MARAGLTSEHKNRGNKAFPRQRQARLKILTQFKSQKGLNALYQFGNWAAIRTFFFM